MEMLQEIWGFIKCNFFYDFRSSVITFCVVVGAIGLYLLLKDNYEKLHKTLRNLVCVIMCFITALVFI